MIRLKDIAARAGVSVMTVSKALREEPDVAAATRTRIRALAANLGYVPNAMAQSLRTRSTRLLGLMIPASVNPVYARVLMAIEDRATALGYDLLLAHSLDKPEHEEAHLRGFLGRGVEGLLVVPVYRMGQGVSAPYREVAARHVPCVLLGHPAPHCAGVASAAPDDVAGAELLTRHLLELGHRRIACLAGPVAAPWAQERYEGYRRALRAADLPMDDQLVYHAGATIEEGFQAGLELLREDTGATAVVAVNDLVAIGAANAMLGQGMRIPQEMSVVGYGNILTAEHYRVPLTTVREPKFRLGVAAMEMLEQLIAGGTVESRRLRGELVERASTAPPAA
ncbi:MAG: LacI family DNA-binding transcriptional regulator [Limisphaerales bacterium]